MRNTQRSIVIILLTFSLSCACFGAMTNSEIERELRELPSQYTKLLNAGNEGLAATITEKVNALLKEDKTVVLNIVRSKVLDTADRERCNYFVSALILYGVVNDKELKASLYPEALKLLKSRKEEKAISSILILGVLLERDDREIQEEMSKLLDEEEETYLGYALAYYSRQVLPDTLFQKVKNIMVDTKKSFAVRMFSVKALLKSNAKGKYKELIEACSKDFKEDDKLSPGYMLILDMAKDKVLVLEFSALLSSEDKKVVIFCLFGLSIIKNTSALPIITKLQKDKDTEIRAAADRAIADITYVQNSEKVAKTIKLVIGDNESVFMSGKTVEFKDLEQEFEEYCEREKIGNSDTVKVVIVQKADMGRFKDVEFKSIEEAVSAAKKTIGKQTKSLLISLVKE